MLAAFFGAERCGQADHWHATMRPHLTGASPAALASGAAARQLYKIATLVRQYLVKI